jgi:hypothetical protein
MMTNPVVSTNTLTATLTNLDEYAATTYYTIAVSTNTFESNTIYTAIAPDGWGYQQAIVIPPSTSTNFNALPGSLAYSILTNAISFTNGLAHPTNEQMFAASIPLWSTGTATVWTNASTASGTFARNANCWLSVSAYPSLTAIVVLDDNDPAGILSHGGTTNSYGFCDGGAAISPRHVIGVGHSWYPPGTRLVFIDSLGNSVTNSVIAGIQSVAGTDIAISLLASDLPSSIVPFKVLPPDFGRWLPTVTNHAQIPAIVCNQQQLLLPKIWAGSADPLWGHSWSLFYNPAFTSTWVPTNALDLYTAQAGGITGGDSGHPLMTIIGTNLVLLNLITYPGLGVSIAYNYDAVNAAMHQLSTNNGLSSDYQLTPADLSAYSTNFAVSAQFPPPPQPTSWSATIYKTIPVTYGSNSVYYLTWPWTNSTADIQFQILAAQTVLPPVISFGAPPDFNGYIKFSAFQPSQWAMVAATTNTFYWMTNGVSAVTLNFQNQFPSQLFGITLPASQVWNYFRWTSNSIVCAFFQVQASNTASGVVTTNLAATIAGVH